MGVGRGHSKRFLEVCIWGDTGDNLIRGLWGHGRSMGKALCMQLAEVGKTALGDHKFSSAKRGAEKEKEIQQKKMIFSAGCEFSISGCRNLRDVEVQEVEVAELGSRDHRRSPIHPIRPQGSKFLHHFPPQWGRKNKALSLEAAHTAPS